MIAYLKGTLTLKSPSHIHVECNGVGYHVNISLHTYSKLEKLENIKIFTYLNVKEDEQSLYGFFDEEERHLFVLLISVSGIGVNTARVILSYMTPEEVKSAILHENDFALGKVKGIGPKTAKRIILDLKDKVIKEANVENSVMPSLGLIDNGIRNEASQALVALGFPKQIVDKNIKVVLDKTKNIEQVEVLIKEVLKQMN